MNTPRPPSGWPQAIHPPGSPARASRGAALLMAMLTVSLVATLASAGLWRQWQAIEVERAERDRAQAAWILRGAVDWARLILREDARATPIDHAGEPWAVPLQETRLDSFLAAEGAGTDAPSSVAQALLSGQIVDLQSRLNVGNLIVRDAPSLADLRAFERLFVQLGLPIAELETMVLRLREASQVSAPGQAGAPPAPLMPRHESQLGWLGLSQATVDALLPHVCVLPARTAVNVNTASAVVLRALVEGLSATDAQRLVRVRTRAPWRSVDEALLALRRAPGGADMPAVDVASRYFRIDSRLQQATLTVAEETRVFRDQGQVRVLDRQPVRLPDQRHRAEFYRGP